MNDNNIPKTEEQPIPLWIKIMWLLGVTWIIGYIFWGLRNNPYTW